jgi:hypothetical protein
LDQFPTDLVFSMNRPTLYSSLFLLLSARGLALGPANHSQPSRPPPTPSPYHAARSGPVGPKPLTQHRPTRCLTQLNPDSRPARAAAHCSPSSASHCGSPAPCRVTRNSRELGPLAQVVAVPNSIGIVLNRNKPRFIPYFKSLSNL